jgi:hypothetical protein
MRYSIVQDVELTVDSCEAKEPLSAHIEFEALPDGEVHVLDLRLFEGYGRDRRAVEIPAWLRRRILSVLTDEHLLVLARGELVDA